MGITQEHAPQGIVLAAQVAEDAGSYVHVVYPARTPVITVYTGTKTPSWVHPRLGRAGYTRVSNSIWAWVHPWRGHFIATGSLPPARPWFVRLCDWLMGVR